MNARFFRNFFHSAKTISKGRPKASIALASTTVATIAFFGFFSSNGSKSSQADRPVYAWGSNEFGLVAPDLPYDAVVKHPRHLPFFKHPLRSISACGTNAAAVDEHGNLLRWGKDFPGGPLVTLRGYQLDRVACIPGGAIVALSGAKNKIWLIEGDSQPREIDVAPLTGRIREMAAGKAHLLVLSEDGKVYSGALSECGNTFGQLGNGRVEKKDERRDEMPKTAKTPTTKRPDLWEIFTKGERYSFAEDSSSQSSAPPASVKILPKISLDFVTLPERAVQIACGDEHSLVLGKSGTVYAFGSNQHLQLGLGEYQKDRALVPSPVKVPLEEGTKVYSIAAGGRTSFFAAVKNNASPASSVLLACGEGTSGQLGNNQWPHVVGNPVRVPKLSGMSWFDEATNSPRPLQVRQISVGGDGHVALVMGTFHPDRQPARQLGDLTHGYDLYLWGQNRFGQLGTGRIGNQAEPQSPIPAETASDQFFLSFPAGAGQFNETNTLALEGGQLQILPDLGHPELVPVQRIYCGPNVTFIY